MQKYTHVKYDERNLFKYLLLSDNCKKKNGTINLSEISIQNGGGRAVNNIKREINRFKKAEDYMLVPVELQKDYKKKKKMYLKNTHIYIRTTKIFKFTI